MKLLIIGANGMLGKDLAREARRQGMEALGVDVPELDITSDHGGWDRLPACDAVVNCAAYTDVDGAETHRDLAFAVNGAGAGRVAGWCRDHHMSLLHLSTDYVFDGSGHRPYREDDPPAPLNAYGESKLAGEQAVAASGCRSLVIRTQSLFGLHGRSFIRAILDRLESGAELRIVNDQTQSPTYTGHLAAGILRLLESGREGIVHVSASGACTWYEFACAIAARVRPGAMLHPVTSAEFPRPARRPAYSVLAKDRYEAWTGTAMPDWREGMAHYLERWREMRERSS